MQIATNYCFTCKDGESDFISTVIPMGFTLHVLKTSVIVVMLHAENSIDRYKDVKTKCPPVSCTVYFIFYVGMTVVCFSAKLYCFLCQFILGNRANYLLHCHQVLFALQATNCTFKTCKNMLNMRRPMVEVLTFFTKIDISIPFKSY